MDQSYSESDASLSPSRILERLQVLRQLQLFQRGKLQKQRLEYEETSEGTSTITEVVSQFSNSTSYNTFRSLLQSSCDTSTNVTPRTTSHTKSPVIKECDLLEGVAAINLSQESEFIVNSPLSSKASAPSRSRNISPLTLGPIVPQNKKQIALDEMPILSPKQDFEELLLEKLKNDKVSKPKKDKVQVYNKKPFLRKGEGMSRFGVKKSDLIIQNTKALPWRKQSLETRVNHTPKKVKNNNNNNIEIITNTELKKITKPEISSTKPVHDVEKLITPETLVDKAQNKKTTTSPILQKTHEIVPKIQIKKSQHPLKKLNREATWAAVLTKEQNDFLRELKQSDYYKNFESPAKSIRSDISCDEHLSKIHQQREVAEQNMFELIENKVTNQSFSLENSFFNRFFKQSMECSGESTPLVLQKCLANNPNLLSIFPGVKKSKSQCRSECSCDYTDCSDTGSVSSCSTCKSVENNNTQTDENSSKKNRKKVLKQKETAKPKKQECENKNSQDDIVTKNEAMKANMADMNAKLVATSELLKDRLRELEDEIETFRKENSNLTKMREEIDLERQKFYEEKSTFEQKFNEEKILSEYYLAEEKEKLTKQKQLYERYVREMRGRLNKKEKDDVITLRKEISDLKEEIRLKDAKSTSTIARLRNQLKLVEKEKSKLQEEIEKLKKENRRIQHSNEITKRLTNVKYLEQINKKLTNLTKVPQSEISLDKDLKYKAFEIERQSRSRKIQSSSKNLPRPRAKSVPNLNVTSRYAKYFSQKDCASHTEGGGDSLNLDNQKDFLDNDEIEDKLPLDEQNSITDNDETYDDDNYLEKIYMERFQNTSPVKNIASLPDGNDNHCCFESNDQFFLRKSNDRESKSPSNNQSYENNFKNSVNRSKSPISVLSNRSSGRKSPALDNYLNSKSGVSDHSKNRSKSPISVLSNRSSGSQRLQTVINQDLYRDKLAMLSPEPVTSKVNLSKTNLNPIEIKKSDGSRELRFPNGNVKYISADEKYTKFVYYNGDIKENFYSEGRIKYYYAEAKTYHTTHADGLEVLEFPDGQVEKRYKDGSTEIRLPNGSVRYHDPKNALVREEWRFPDGTSLTVSASGEQRILFSNGQVEVHAEDHKRREYPDGTVKLIYNDGTSETRYASGRVRIKDKHGNLIMDSAPG